MGQDTGRELVAVVPNFSEGRRADVMDAICAALEVPGVRLVYRQADPDHNRLDTTVIGDPNAARRSALAGAAAAVELIDMERHRGSHPRMGAADVIPFVPIRDISMDEVVELARDVARELADTLDLPVYLYDRAALSPQRQSLAEVRKGEYEALRAAVARGERLPDFGPHRIGRAGATAVGARKPLIAFNVYLSGTDEPAAKEIARSVRESSGGLPAVRAIGFLVPERGCVTVSMNLVDPDVTGLRDAFDAVSVEAGKRGMAVLSSEIVGLVPASAISDDDVPYLRLEGFDAEHQILERLVSAAQTTAAAIKDRTVARFLDALASDAPTPGGGAVAALAGAAGAALVEMVCNLTIDKKGYEDAWDRMRHIRAVAEAGRRELLALADKDATAFDGVMAAFRMPKDTDEQRSARSKAIQGGYLDAAQVPLEIARTANGLLPLAVESVERGNAQAASDGVSAGQMLFTATECAIYNVQINAAALNDPATATPLRDEVSSIRTRAEELLAEANAAFAASLNP